MTTATTKLPDTVDVEITIPAVARRRADLPDVWTVEIEVDGAALRRHYRPGDDGQLEDATEAVALDLVEFAKRRKAEERKAQRVQAKRVGKGDAVKVRAERGEVAVEETMQAGVTRARALTALDTINRRHLLTMRQFEGGDRLGRDWKIINGAREARELPSDPDSLAGRDREDWAALASRQFDRARTACMRAPFFEGVSPWSVVEDVVIHDRALRDAAGSRDSGVLARFKAALRIGLDLVADAYGIPDAAVFRKVVIDRVPVSMVMAVDLDGLDRHENPIKLFRALRLNGSPWVAVAASAHDLDKLARSEMHRRLVGLLGADVFRDGRVEEGVKLDREWNAAQAEDGRREATALRRERKEELEQERHRVVGDAPGA